MSRIPSSRSRKRKAINTSSASPDPASPNPPSTPSGSQTQGAAPELPRAPARRTDSPFKRLSKKFRAAITSPRLTLRPSPPCPPPDPNLEEMAAKRLEEEEDLMEEDLKAQVPGWIVMDSISQNRIKERYRLAEKGEVDHFPGLIRRANDEQLMEGDEEREEVLKARFLGYQQMIPEDRKALMINERWQQRGGWGE